jgi:hypothetical protein
MIWLTIVAGVKLWFFLNWAYIALMHVRKVRPQLTLYWKVMLYTLLVPAYVADVLVNLTFGTIMFREIPREFLFSSRVQRHYDAGNPLAVWWAKQLNVFDNHIK